MAVPTREVTIRAKAISHVMALATRSRNGTLTWSQIAEGFEHDGERILVANRARGIFTPKMLTVGALSIRTSFPRAGRERRYDDQIGSDAPYFEYRYQGEDPDAHDNRKLRECMTHQLPVLYFYASEEAVYRPHLCFVSGEDPERRTFFVATPQDAGLADHAILKAAAVIPIERRYSIVEVRQRLHQDRFRAAVMEAYTTRCAVCSLRHGELLDAAHIVPDGEVLGEAKVPNGLALCKLHHAAFDANLIGVSPDLVVKVRRDLLDEIDGPLLDHGLKDFHDAHLRVVPHAPNDRPDRDLLGRRYADFRKAVG